MQQNLNFSTLSLALSALILAPFAALADAIPNQAQTATNPAPASIEALVAVIVEHNPELNFYLHEIEAAAGEVKTAGAFANPEVSSQLGHKKVNDLSGALQGEGQAWSVSVQQTFEWPGRISLKKAIANRQLELSRLGFERFRIALAGRARTLAFTLFAANEKNAAVSDVAERFRALREVLVSRDPAGLTPLLETRIIEATELTIQRRASEAEIAAKSALLELNKLRGAPWEETLRISAPTLSFPKTPPVPELLSAARTNNFELRSREIELVQQGFRLSLAKNERYPAVSVGPFYSQERAGDRERTFGIGLSIALPFWNRNTGKISTEEARRLQAETLVKTTHREIERQTLEAATIYDTKIREMNRWQPESVQEFQKAAELSDRHYRLGAVPITTYVEMQKQYLEAVEALLDTRKEALEALQNLRALTGLRWGLPEWNPERKDMR